MALSGNVPCSPWSSIEEVRRCCAGLNSDADLERAIQFASAILFRLSGRQFPGVCEKTVWPCSSCSCGTSAWTALAASGWHYGASAPSTPYRVGDGWANCWDCGSSMGSGSCAGGCNLPTLELPGLVQDVTEVVIHGERLPRSAYALKNRAVVRLDGGTWPCSNDLSGPFPYEDSEFDVTVAAAGGTYDLIVFLPAGPQTVHVPFSAPASTLAGTLEGVVGAGNVRVTGGPGNAGGSNPYHIAFDTYAIGTATSLGIDVASLSGTASLVMTADGFVPPADSWYVTYTYGKPVPADGRMAASKFACELALAMCGSDACVLPARLKSIHREGVDMAFADPLEFIGKGEVGIYEVDLWLNSVNPKKLARRASVYRVDAPAPVQGFRRG